MTDAGQEPKWAKGVNPSSRNGTWSMAFQIRGKRHPLTLRCSQAEAAVAYDLAACWGHRAKGNDALRCTSYNFPLAFYPPALVAQMLGPGMPSWEAVKALLDHLAGAGALRQLVPFDGAGQRFDVTLAAPAWDPQPAQQLCINARGVHLFRANWTCVPMEEVESFGTVGSLLQLSYAPILSSSRTPRTVTSHTFRCPEAGAAYRELQEAAALRRKAGLRAPVDLGGRIVLPAGVEPEQPGEIGAAPGAAASGPVPAAAAAPAGPAPVAAPVAAAATVPSSAALVPAPGAAAAPAPQPAAAGPVVGQRSGLEDPNEPSPDELELLNEFARLAASRASAPAAAAAAVPAPAAVAPAAAGPAAAGPAPALAAVPVAPAAADPLTAVQLPIKAETEQAAAGDASPCGVSASGPASSGVSTPSARASPAPSPGEAACELRGSPVREEAPEPAGGLYLAMGGVTPAGAAEAAVSGDEPISSSSSGAAQPARSSGGVKRAAEEASSGEEPTPQPQAQPEQQTAQQAAQVAAGPPPAKKRRTKDGSGAARQPALPLLSALPAAAGQLQQPGMVRIQSQPAGSGPLLPQQLAGMRLVPLIRLVAASGAPIPPAAMVAFLRRQQEAMMRQAAEAAKDAGAAGGNGGNGSSAGGKGVQAGAPAPAAQAVRPVAMLPMAQMLPMAMPGAMPGAMPAGMPAGMPAAMQRHALAVLQAHAARMQAGAGGGSGAVVAVPGAPGQGKLVVPAAFAAAMAQQQQQLRQQLAAAAQKAQQQPAQA